MPPATEIPFFDLSDPEFSVTSPEVRRARQASWYAHTNFGLAVLRYEQAAGLIRHPMLRQGSAAWPAHHGITAGPFARWWDSWVLNKEGQDHRRLRRVLNPVFTRRTIEPLVPPFRALATELADGFAERGQCEFMSEFAVPFAARAVALLLGVEQDSWRAIASDASTVGLAMGVTVAANLARIEAALASLFRLADDVIADRQRRPRDDVVTSLAAAVAGPERLTGQELRDVLALLIFGGFDTTRNQLGLAVAVFAAYPGQWRLLAERPELAPAAVEEVMRVRPTTTWVTREALDDFVFDGLEIARGTTVHLFTEAAGTDPRLGAGADFDITVTGRPPHLGFGGGVHYCLGHLVARADMSAALAVLAARMPGMALAGGAAWLPDSGNTGPVRLPVAFTRGT